MPRRSRFLGPLLAAGVLATVALLFLRESPVPPPPPDHPDAGALLDEPAPHAPGAPSLVPTTPDDVTIFAPGIGTPPPPVGPKSEGK